MFWTQVENPCCDYPPKKFNYSHNGGWRAELNFISRQNKLLCEDVLHLVNFPIYYKNKYMVTKMKPDTGNSCCASHTTINLYIFLSYIIPLLLGG